MLPLSSAHTQGFVSQPHDLGPNPAGALSVVASNILVIVKAQQTPSRVMLLPGDVVGAMAQTH